ncbi:MAG TPA: RHS repeat-associated core domain-containing protein [Candidatus Limnocylindrales bacterium]|nr:RHS repeat-associated core domain-containing protein [Candidatus Limnocylindrales bacterium]
MKRVAWFGVLVMALSLMVVPPPGLRLGDAAAAAEADPAAGEGGSGSTGAFTTSVPLSVPEFHGLEPELSLAYDSGSGNGFTGMGWTLTGQSFVERSGPGGGVPRYDANDVFLLDGRELVVCTTLGGTHCPRQQTFQRIRRDAAGDRWEVWDTDGTKSVYAPVYPTSRGTFRWALSTETDTHGNTVTYSYWRQAPDNAYLDSISYNGTVIKLWREPRPDPVSFTNGEAVAYTNLRLRSIDIRTGGERVRAYKLTYGQAPSTGRSRLAGVQQFGRDAVVDAAGAVTSGTALPAVALSYQDGLARLGATAFNGPAGGWDTSLIRDMFADIDGDGRTDMVRLYKNGSNEFAQVSKSNGAGFPAASFNGSVGGWNASWHDLLGDVTGDGQADLVRIWQHPTGNAYAQVTPSNGAGFPTASFNGPVGGWATCCIKDYLADINGDYRADLIRLYQNGTDTYAQVSLSNGAGFPTASFNGSVGGWATSIMDYLVDVNGDSRADLVRIWNNGDAFAQVNLSNGAGFPAQFFNGPVGGWNSSFYNHFADLNGDGKADLIRIWNNGGTAWAQVSLSTGVGYPAPSWNASIGTWNTSLIDDEFADINGDGRPDLLRIYRNGVDKYAEIRPYDGRGFPTASFNGPIGGWSENWKSHLVDVSGDGKTDVVTLWQHPSGLAYARVDPATGPTPDLLSSVRNGTGGTTSVQYSPSTRWWSAGHNLPSVFPTVSAVTQNDGRGTSFTAAHTFANGLWAWHPAERRFLGFRTATVKLDGEGTYRETVYRQTLAGAGRVERSLLKAAAGQTYEQDQYQYTERTSPPYSALVSAASHFECNLAAACRQSRVDYAYDAYGNETVETDHGDVARTGDEIITTTTYAPNTTAFIVDPPAIVTVTTPGGAQLSRSVSYYDGATGATTPPVRGDLTREEVWNNDTGGYVATITGYDGWGNAASVTDSRGFTATTTFDDIYHLFPVRACNALNHCAVTEWDTVLAAPTAITDANGARTSNGYDPLGRQISKRDPVGAVTTWQYLDTGNPGSQRVREIRPDGSADGLWAETFSDGLGRAWQTVREGPAPGVTYVQDRAYRSTTDLVWKESAWRLGGQPARYTATTYDGAGRAARVTHPDGSSATVSYTMGTDNRPLVTAVDELGKETTTLSDVDGNVVEVRERNGTDVYLTRYDYDPLGQLVRWTDAAGNSSTVTYNSLGWKTGMVDMDAGRLSYEYDAGGLLVRQVDAKNQATTMAYDALGRITSRTEAGNRVSSWHYDEPGHGAAIGHLTRTAYPAGSDAHTWDINGQETSTTQCIDAICRTMSSTFDGLGRLAILTYPDGEAVAHSYNAAGELSSVGGYVTAMAWNPSGQLTSMSYANGTVTNYTYDPDREWLNTVSVRAGTATRYQASYQYNAAGLVISMAQGTPTAATTTYTYDDLRRLIAAGGAQNQTFAYDPIGNITTNSAVGSYSYTDPAHRHAVTSAGSASYVYDANGNLTSGGGRSLSWDGANRVASVTAAGVTTTFVYDAGERRLKKTAGSDVTRYFGTQVEEANGVLSKYYYAGPLLVARASAGSRTWYHMDRLGSTRLLTDDSGAEVADYGYTAFGVRSSTGTVANERGFTGHLQDDSTGLTYMGARYQDPVLGRFISPDTIVPEIDDPQDINRYSYAGNNPVNNVDPTGHKPCYSAKCQKKGPAKAKAKAKAKSKATSAQYKKKKSYAKKPAKSYGKRHTKVGKRSGCAVFSCSRGGGGPGNRSRFYGKGDLAAPLRVPDYYVVDFTRIWAAEQGLTLEPNVVPEGPIVATEPDEDEWITSLCVKDGAIVYCPSGGGDGLLPDFGMGLRGRRKQQVPSVGVGVSVGAIITRSGRMYFYTGVATGSEGFSSSVRAGWLAQSEAPTDAEIDAFVSGRAYTFSSTTGSTSSGLTYSPGVQKYAVEFGWGSAAGWAVSAVNSAPITD